MEARRNRRPQRNEPDDNTPPPTEAELKRRARELATIRLSVREYAAKEMTAYLKRKGIPDAIASETTEAMVREKLLDDRRYARAVTRSQSTRDKGPRYIHAKLRQKGVRIELDEVKGIFADASDRSELDLARQVVDKRYPRAREDQRELKRAYSALLRRGFSSEVVRKALWGKVEEPDEA